MMPGMDSRLSQLLIAAIAERAETPEAVRALIGRMARAADIQPDTVRQILRGEIETPPRHRLSGFAQVLNLRLDDLLSVVDREDADRETADLEAAARAVQQGAGLALAAEDGAAPAWVQLTPGSAMAARDGRFWRLSSPDAVIAAFRAHGADLPVDMEHATQIRGASGEAAPAVGWIKEIVARAAGGASDAGAALWARVEWLDAGRKAVASRAYRYLSPAFTWDKATGEVTAIVSAALTNTPALRMAALSRAEKETPMDLSRLAKAADLPETASLPEIEVAVCAMKQMRDRADAPDMAKFAPRADVEQALARAQAAEAALKARDDADLTARIAAAVDGAVEAGKIAPAARGFYVDACRAEGGLDKFVAMVAASPALVASATPAAKPDGGAGFGALTAEDLAVCAALGIDKADFAKLKGEAA